MVGRLRSWRALAFAIPCPFTPPPAPPHQGEGGRCGSAFPSPSLVACAVSASATFASQSYIGLSVRPSWRDERRHTGVGCGPQPWQRLPTDPPPPCGEGLGVGGTNAVRPLHSAPPSRSRGGEALWLRLPLTNQAECPASVHHHARCAPGNPSRHGAHGETRASCALMASSRTRPQISSTASMKALDLAMAGSLLSRAISTTVLMRPGRAVITATRSAR